MMNQLSLSTADNQPFSCHQRTDRVRSIAAWKKWVAALALVVICVTYLGPLLLSLAGRAWIDDDRLNQLHAGTAAGYVHIDEMPDYVWKAFVAIEDHRFMQHDGVDPVALARALWVDLQAGAYVQGGSTITMQLARNLFLTNEKTLLRKMKEIAIAVELERRYSKQELLEMYLNVIDFGLGRYGIGGAADLYFGKGGEKGIRSLTVGEAALLASLPKAPEAYSPLKHWEKAKQRQQLVLERMAALHMISETDKSKAVTEPITLNRPAQPAAF
jgi:monofunctional glycosyltransferase